MTMKARIYDIPPEFESEIAEEDHAMRWWYKCYH